MPDLRAAVATPYRRGVVALALLTLVWRGWTVARWSWQNDDWQHIERSITMPFWPYLFHEHHGHVVPGAFFVTKLMTEAAPLDFSVVVGVTALTCAVTVLVWGRAFELITGGRLLALAPLAVASLSPVYVEPLQWWSGAMLAAPMQLALGLMVVAACRWSVSRRRRDLLWLGLAYLFGLFFWHKSALLTVPVAVVLVALGRGGPVQRVRSAWPPLALLFLVSVPYLALFRWITERSTASYDLVLTLEDRSFADTVQQYAHGFADMFLPALLGGPWGSMQTDHHLFSQPSAAVTTLVLVVCAAAVVWLARRHRSTLWLLLLPLGYTLLSVGVVLFSTRADDVWDVMAMERYFVDPVAVAMLALALMIREADLHRPATGADDAAGSGRAVPAAVLGLVALSLVVSNVLAADRVGTHPGREWVDNLRTDVVRLSDQRDDGSPLVLWDAYSPDTVLQPVWWNESALLSNMLLPFGDRVRFDVPSDRIYQVGPDGRILPSQISRLSTSAAGPDQDCGYYVEPGATVDVPMSAALFHWGWGMELTAFSATGGELVVDLGSGEVEVELPAGLQTRSLQVAGEVAETVRVSVPADAAGPLCLNDLHVGEPEPAT